MTLGVLQICVCVRVCVCAYCACVHIVSSIFPAITIISVLDG